MSTDASTANTIRMERAILAALCQIPRQDPTIIEFLRLLPAYRWHSNDCRAIYDALANWPAEPAEIRKGLAARITRLGFPDIDTDFCFEVSTVIAPAALASLRAEIEHQQPSRALHPETSSRTR